MCEGALHGSPITAGASANYGSLQAGADAFYGVWADNSPVILALGQASFTDTLTIWGGSGLGTLGLTGLFSGFAWGDAGSGEVAYSIAINGSPVLSRSLDAERPDFWRSPEHPDSRFSFTDANSVPLVRPTLYD